MGIYVLFDEGRIFVNGLEFSSGQKTVRLSIEPREPGRVVCYYIDLPDNIISGRVTVELEFTYTAVKYSVSVFGGITIEGIKNYPQQEEEEIETEEEVETEVEVVAGIRIRRMITNCYVEL
jgi:hypothetical protein